jgi:hypothetical protein
MGPERVVHLAAPAPEQRVVDHHHDRRARVQQPAGEQPPHQQSQPAEGSLLHYAAASNWDYQTHHDRKTSCLRGWLERLGVVGSMLHPG